MKKFNSFRDIHNRTGDLSNFIKDHKKYWAHIQDKNGNHNGNFETLDAHNSLVSKYWISLIEEYQLEGIIENHLEKIIEYFSKVNNHSHFGNCLKEMVWATMFFHDFGKINTNFQTKRMNNPEFCSSDKISFGSEHSKLSAFVFFNSYLGKILHNEQLSRNEQYILSALALVFGNTILKHHSGRINNDILFDSETIKSALLFKSNLLITINENYSFNFLTKTGRVFQELQKRYTEKNNFGFSLFSLIKLSYSLLTASDYYATSEYMNNLSITDFGIIDEELRQRVANSFVNNEYKPYNKDLIEKTENFINIPFEDLEERNNKNLNLLRQKLASEAIQKLRNHYDQHLFYLEAPTGGGKTNISIAFATELLKLKTSLSKIFYVFPFTTLVDQTFQSIKDTIDIKDDEIIQLHSKAGFPSKNSQEGEYGSNYKNYIDYLFVNYPITLLTHIRFFDILKGNSKEANYLLHRLANSIVIIDELQSYPPKHWDKIIYFLDNYARLLNIKVLIMSATLPKIDELNDQTKGKIVELTKNRNKYFLNPNFGNRVTFEYLNWNKPKSDEEKKDFLKNLSKFIYEKSEEYALGNDNKVRSVVEFISKKTASSFLKTLSQSPGFEEYSTYLISGEILESRRKEIINKIKHEEDDKVVVVTTQVIEAGMDIDMDIGFKDRSLIDSEEQLAGRINREAKKQACKLYIFDLDKTRNIYGRDYRYNIQTKDEWIDKNYMNILKEKNYHALYQRVNQKLKEEFKDSFDERSQYWEFIKNLNLHEINQKFKLIDQDTRSLFIPLKIDNSYFNQSDLMALSIIPDENNKVSGEEVFEKYIELVENTEADFTLKNIDLKKMAGIMSQFIISIFPNQLDKLKEYKTPEAKYGYEYLINWQEIYSYHSGFDMDKIKEDIFI